MLGLCRAIIVAPTRFDSRVLAELAAEVGFGDVASVFDDAESGNGLSYPVSYFLVHHRLSDSDCDDVIDAVRSIDRRGLRFSPMVVMLPESSRESMRKFISMGFDDVISLPQSQVQLTARLGTQLDRDIVYYETADYLGPDRRRADANGCLHRSSTIAPHTRIVLRRDPEHGTRVLSRQPRGHQHFTVAKPEIRPAAPVEVMAAGRDRVFGRRQQPPELAPVFHKEV